MAVCTTHQDVSTGLSCTACSRPFCYKCLIQGPVGAKCRDCARGIAIDASRKERARVSIKAGDSDRLLTLKIVLGAYVVVNIWMLSFSGAFSFFMGDPHPFSAQPGAVREGEWWRLLTGSVAVGSGFFLVVATGLTWWIGRIVAPRLGRGVFLSVVAMSAAAGVLFLQLRGKPQGNYGAAFLPGSMLGSYVALRARGVGAKLSLPFGGRISYGLFFLGWMVFGSLSSEPSTLWAMGGGMVAAGLAVWLRFDLRRRESSVAGFATTSVLATVLLFGASAAVANRSTVNRFDRGFGPTPTLAEDDLTEKDNTIEVSMWSENVDQDSSFNFSVDCSAVATTNVWTESSPTTPSGGSVPAGAAGAAGASSSDKASVSPNSPKEIKAARNRAFACSWLRQHATSLQPDPSALLGECRGSGGKYAMVNGYLNGRLINAVFKQGASTSSPCGTFALSKEAMPLLAALVPEP